MHQKQSSIPPEVILWNAFLWWSGGLLDATINIRTRSGAALRKLAERLDESKWSPDVFCYFCLFERQELPAERQLLSIHNLWFICGDASWAAFEKYQDQIGARSRDRRIASYRWLRTHENDPGFPDIVLEVDPLAVLEHLLRKRKVEAAATFARMHFGWLELTRRGNPSYYSLHNRSRHFLGSLARAQEICPHKVEEKP